MARRRILVAMVALSMALLVRPVAVGPALACSCAMLDDPIGTAATDPQQWVFSGVVQDPVVQGTPVVLTRWFRGPAPQAVVWLDIQGFEDPLAGTCGTTRPPASTEWIFAAYRSEGGKFGVDMCSPHAALATVEGQRMLQRAVEVMGPPALPVDAEAADPPSSPVAAVVPILVGLMAIIGLVGGAFLVVGRRER